MSGISQLEELKDLDNQYLAIEKEYEKAVQVGPWPWADRLELDAAAYKNAAKRCCPKVSCVGFKPNSQRRTQAYPTNSYHIWYSELAF